MATFVGLVNVLYAFTGAQGIYRSDDAGQTLRQETHLTAVTVRDAFVDQRSGNVMAALGAQGLMVRTPVGAWQAVAVEK